MNAPELDAPTANWLVYGDALQEAGDPRGELIALSHGVDEGRIDAAARDAYIAAHAVVLLGGAAAHRAHFELRFRFCEIIGARIRIEPDDDVVELVPALLAAAPHLRELELVADPVGGRAIALARALALVAKRAELRSLALVDAQAERSAMLVSRDYDPGPNLVDFGPLEALWPSQLEALRIVIADSHQLELGDLDAPELRTFALACLRYGDGYGEDAPLSETLAAARWPKLETFALRIPETFMANVVNEVDPYVSMYADTDAEDDGDHDPVNWDELDGLLANLAKCKQLHRIALTSFEAAGTLLPAIERAGLAPTVTELDLSDSGLSDADARWMAARRPLFAHVKRLVIERTSVSDPDLPKSLGCDIAHSIGEGARYRYVVGQE